MDNKIKTTEKEIKFTKDTDGYVFKGSLEEFKEFAKNKINLIGADD